MSASRWIGSQLTAAPVQGGRPQTGAGTHAERTRLPPAQDPYERPERTNGRTDGSTGQHAG